MIRLEDLDHTDFSDIAEPGAARLPPVSPGEILQQDFMDPLALSANALGKALHVPANRITAILKAERAITADTALRLARYFGSTPQFWLNLQQQYDLDVAQRAIGAQVAHDVHPRAA